MKQNPPPQRQSITDSSERSYTTCVRTFYHDNRGQTLFDFVLGMTLFLGVVGFTVVFVPDLLDPFEPSQESSTILADRGADHLTQNVMRADGEGPYILETSCTVALFDGDAVSECDVDSNKLRDIVGMEDNGNAHVKIINDNSNTITVDGVTMEHGNDIDRATSDVFTATRIVTVNGDRYTLVFNVW